MLDFDGFKELILFYLIVALMAICAFILVTDRCFFIPKIVEHKELKIDDYKIANIKRNLYLSKIFSVLMCALIVLIVFLIFFFSIYEAYLYTKKDNN